MSRITTSLASFSGARAAIRRACSRDVRGSKAPYSVRIRVAAVKAHTLNFPRHGVRNQPAERLPPLHPPADLAGRDVRRGDLEELDAFWPFEALQDGVEHLGCVPGTRRHPEPRQLQHLVRILPGAKG